VYSIDTIFILGDGLTRLLLRWNLLLLRWEKSAPILFCSWIFLGWTKGGVPGGIRTRDCRTAARRDNHIATPHPYIATPHPFIATPHPFIAAAPFIATPHPNHFSAMIFSGKSCGHVNFFKLTFIHNHIHTVHSLISIRQCGQSPFSSLLVRSEGKNFLLHIGAMNFVWQVDSNIFSFQKVATLKSCIPWMWWCVWFLSNAK
jgi:hypothetical protein